MTTDCREEEFFLGPTGLYTAFYPAESAATAILIPPLFEEHPRTRKLLINTARRLASLGIRAVRFDYAGTGLSHGSGTELSPANTLRDMDTVCCHTRANFGSRILLIGLRYGGYAALRYRNECNRSYPCLLWEPITDLSHYVAACLKIALANQLVTYGTIRMNQKELVARLESGLSVLVDGYALTGGFYKQGKTEAKDIFSHPLSLADAGMVWWKSSAGHASCQKMEIPSTFLPGIRTSWENIRYIDNQPEALLEFTANWCRYHAT